MKTIRTIIATLSGVLLTFALAAWFSVRKNAAFIQRTIYQGFDQTFVVALVMGCAFLLIAVILSVAIVSTDEEEEEEEFVRPAPRPRSQGEMGKRLPSEKGEQPYRRVTRSRTAEQGQTSKGDEGFARPKAKEGAQDRSAAPKRPRAAERPDEIAFREAEAPVKKKASKPKAKPEADREERPLDGPVDKAEEGQALTAEEPKTMETVNEPETPPAPVPEAPEDAGETSKTDQDSEAEAEIRAEEDAPRETSPSEEPESAAQRGKEEGTVRCVFCGGVMGRDSQTCPHCGKKR